MNDNEKELHRLAALAAGYEVYFWSDKVARMDLPLRPLWEPLRSAGDSFRLLIAIRKWSADNAIAWPEVALPEQTAIIEFMSSIDSGDEDRAMTSIFNLAVELGRRKESGK